jgi:hypothetical protein
MEEGMTIKRCLAWMLVLSLTLTTLTFSPTLVVSVGAETLAEIDTRARQYDNAIREIEGTLSLNLSTAAGAAQANEIIKRNLPYLKFCTAKGLSIALRNSTFLAGIKTLVAKQGAANVAKALNSDPESVMRIAGAEEAASAVRLAMRSASARLKRVSDVLKNASAAGLQRLRHHPGTQAETHEPILSNVVRTNPANANSVAPQEEIIASFIVLVLILAVFHIVKSQIEGRQPGGYIEKCLENAEAAYEKCLQTAGVNPFAMLACHATALASEALCQLGL